MSVFRNLTEGLVDRNLSRETPAMLKKWESTGLLEGLTDEAQRSNMAVLLENQAKQLLQETTTMSGGDVEGFAAVAFPLVRRVFAGLIANELVSVQPMNLPSGLIFFLDITKEAPSLDYDANDTRDGLKTGERHKESVYGGGVIGREQLDGVTLGGANDQGFRNLRQGFTSARGAIKAIAAGSKLTAAAIAYSSDAEKEAAAKEVEYDIDIIAALEAGKKVTKVTITAAELVASGGGNITGHPIQSPDGSWARRMGPSMTHVNLTQTSSQAISGQTVIRRKTKVEANGDLTIYLQSDDATAWTAQDSAVEFAMADNITEASATHNNGVPANTDTLGALMGDYAWEMEGTRAIPEINIKVDSAAITSTSRKLKASWTPELAQDLNAYQSVDAEVELTGILSEEIALEIDQEILGDLMRGAKAATYYWYCCRMV